MPEYLAPGVYVEEVSFRSKTIEGVPTSTTGFVGMTRTGPVQYRIGGERGPSTTEPRLITSFTEFERVYGGLERLHVGSPEVERESYLAQAARAFFMNGGKRLYVSRVFVPLDPTDPNPDWGVASHPVAVGPKTATWRARWPGRFGEVFVRTQLVRTRNINRTYSDPIRAAWGPQAPRARAGAVVEIIDPGVDPPINNDPLTKPALVVVDPDGRQRFRAGGADVNPTANHTIQLVELRVTVGVDNERVDAYDELAAHPDQKRFVGRILDKDDPADEDAVVWLDWTPDTSDEDEPAALMEALRADANPRLTSGHDGEVAQPDDLLGEAADLDHADVKATGLEALGEIDDIAIVAAPDGGTYDDEVLCQQAGERLVGHAEGLRYRIAVVDPPPESSMNEVRAFRGKFDSKYAAVYYPWVEILDPTERAAQGAPPKRLLLPPSGFVTGIYARSDIERGVYKAPANEVVRGLTKFEANINKARQDVLNPEGVNALRFFPGRGSRVWGARTMSSDPEWKYVNVRRLFIYLEHSIDKASQWAVFEPNNQRLWSNVRQTIEDFLLVQWQTGALLGAKPEEAYFVRCDRTTMTQNDLDNGRLICLIGVAPTKPAEFVIFRIGQWTADSKLN